VGISRGGIEPVFSQSEDKGVGAINCELVANLDRRSGRGFGEFCFDQRSEPRQFR